MSNPIAEDVARSIRRTALLYRHFAETLLNELGPERAKELISQAIWAYGGQIGREARERALEEGLELTPENFFDDLPSVGWENYIEIEDGESITRVARCPLAEEWHDMDQSLARLYCYVDQAKMQAFNPDFIYVHLSNTLDGDDCCRLVVRSSPL